MPNYTYSSENNYVNEYFILNWIHSSENQTALGLAFMTPIHICHLFRLQKPFFLHLSSCLSIHFFHQSFLHFAFNGMPHYRLRDTFVWYELISERREAVMSSCWMWGDCGVSGDVVVSILCLLVVFLEIQLGVVPSVNILSPFCSYSVEDMIKCEVLTKAD